MAKRPPFHIISNEISRCPDITPSAYRVYGFLSTYGKTIFPSYKTIMKQTGMARATVRKAIKHLEDMKLLNYDRGNSTGKSNFYYLSDRLYKPSSKNEPPSDPMAKNCTTPSSKNELKVVQKMNSNKTYVSRLIEKESLNKLVDRVTKGKTLDEIAEDLELFETNT